jgi:hypothetical protein
MSLLSTSCKMLSNILLSRLSPDVDETTVHYQCGFQCNNQLLIIFSVRHWSKTWSIMSHCISYVQTSRKPDSFMREVLNSIFNEIGIPMKLFRLNKMCSRKTYTKAHLGKWYCGVAPKGRSIESPLLINGYASSSGFIGNDCKPTQRPT